MVKYILLYVYSYIKSLSIFIPDKKYICMIHAMNQILWFGLNKNQKVVNSVRLL